jgi:hypothetical protein
MSPVIINYSSENDLLDAFNRCYLGNVKVTLPSGKIYTIFFSTPLRISQEIDFLVKRNRPNVFYAEKNLIIINEVTSENIEAAVEKLYEDDFFECLISEN